MEFERYTDIKRLNFIADALRQSLPAQGQVLDVGCGNGVITRSLGEKGFRVRGIDVSEKAIAKARSLNHNPLVQFDVVSAEQLVADGQSYDAIVCSEVLEHLQDPNILLRTLHASLKEKGILIVTVPNGKGMREVLVTKPFIALQKKNNWMWRTLLKTKRTLGYRGTTVQSDADDLTHIQFFSKSALKELAAKNSFEIIRFGKTNFIEDVFPFSLLTKKIKFLQKWDCAVAEMLPDQATGGFVTVWKKK